jgi:DNA-binding NarL/FixJ family response regulator
VSIRVLIVDDNALLRAGLATVLASDPGIEVVGEAASGPEGVHRCDELQPDIVLMDVEMPGGGGISATSELRARHPGIRVLILTMFDVDDYVAEALRAGAAGFLLKTTEPHALLRAVKDCALGETTLSPRVLEQLIDSFVARPEVPAPPRGYDVLTEREREVFRSLADGRSNAEIAAHLHLAETTVKTHVAQVLLKLGVRDRVQAAVLAHRAGLVDPTG